MIPWLAAAWAGDPHLPHGPGVRWHTIDTRWFRVHWAEGPGFTSRATAERAAALCDPLLLRLAADAQFVPHGPYDLVVSDATDGMTAYARPAEGVVVIGADPGAAVLRLRGRIDWVEDALAHELGHLVWDRRSTPFAPTGGYGVEAVGVAQVGPLAAAVDGFFVHDLPYGFGEALAERASEAAGVNRWDERRQGLLLAAARDDRLLTWDEWTVGVDKGDTFDAERAYQQGYAFLRWLADEAGPDVWRGVADAWARRPRTSLSAVLAEVTGVDGRTWWARHRGHLLAEALAADARRLASVDPSATELERYLPSRGQAAADAAALERPREEEARRESTGSWDLNPTWSPDRRFYAESKARVTRVVRWTGDGAPDGPSAWLSSETGAAPVFSPLRDAVWLVSKTPPSGRSPLTRTAPFSSVWAVGLEPDEAGELRPGRRWSTRVPGTERTRELAATPGGELVLVRHLDGGDQVWAGPAGHATRRSSFPPQTWIQGPSVSPDGARLAVSVFRGGRGELWLADLPGWRWSRVPLPVGDVLDPEWGPDGRLLATAVVDGVWQVVRVDVGTGAVEALTHTLAGASTPTWGPDGALWFSETTAAGLKSSALAAADVWPRAVAPAALPAVASVPAAAVGPSRPYRAAPRPPSVGPLLRLESDPRTAGSAGGPRAALGGWFDLHDPVETWSAEVFGLLGTVSGGEVALGWEGLGMPLSARVSGATTADGDRWQARVDLGAPLAWGDGVVVEPSASWLEADGLRSRRLGLSLGEAEALQQRDPGLRGGLLLTAAVTEANRATTPWARAEGELRTRAALGLRTGPLDEEVVWVEGGVAGGVSTTVGDPREELALGGDLWSAWRPLAVEGSLAFPALPPWALSGQHAGVASARLAVPVAPRARQAAGAFYLQGLEVAPGVDVGAVAPRGEVVAAAVAELRLVARWQDHAFGSSVVVAKSFDGAPPRVQLELGGARP